MLRSDGAIVKDGGANVNGIPEGVENTVTCGGVEDEYCVVMLSATLLAGRGPVKGINGWMTGNLVREYHKVNNVPCRPSIYASQSLCTPSQRHLGRTKRGNQVRHTENTLEPAAPVVFAATKRAEFA